MANRMDDLARRFFGSVGLVESAGYEITEVLLGGQARAYFRGRDYLRYTTSTEVAREDPTAEVLTYGSALLESMTEAALALGSSCHLYLQGFGLTTGRTLEKVRQRTRIPGRIAETGREEPFLYHHAAFRLKVALAADAREETFDDVAVDLHSGWATAGVRTASLQAYAGKEAPLYPETPVVLTLGEACARALGALQRPIESRVQARQAPLLAAAAEEKAQVLHHYETIIQRLEAGKSRKGANVERIDDKVRSTLLDRDRRLEDVERKFRLAVEVTAVQAAIVSYPKVAMPLLVQQGKDLRPGMAVWDPLVHEGYFYLLPEPGPRQ